MSISVMSKVFYTNFPELPSRKIKIKDSNKERVVNISPHVAKIVMLAISDSADDFGQNSWNSLERLAIKTNLHRRTVIRTIEVLAENDYLMLNGLSEYRTNNIGINLDKLSDPPKKRSKTGRPQNDEEVKTSGSESETSGSESETSGSEPPDSSLSIQNHPLQKELQEPIQTIGKEDKPMRSKEELMKGTEEAFWKGISNQSSGYAHFPERIVPVVERMEKYWKFKAPGRKSKQYSFWISSCDEILEACAEFGTPVLDKLYEDWVFYMDNNGGAAPYPVSSPKSLLSAVLGKAALLRSGNSVHFWTSNKQPQKQSMLDV